MARQGTLTRAVIRHSLLALLVLLIALPVLAQDQATSAAAAKFAKIQATSDSLGFGSTAADSLQEIPRIIEPIKGLMGVVDRSPLGKTGVGKLFIAGGVFMWWILAVALVGFIVIVERMWTLNRARVNTRRLLGTVITTLRNDEIGRASCRVRV